MIPTKVISYSVAGKLYADQEEARRAGMEELVLHGQGYGAFYYAINSMRDANCTAMATVPALLAQFLLTSGPEFCRAALNILEWKESDS